MYKELFAKKLKKARENTGFTQVDVSREVKIPRSTIANYETGRTEPDLENVGILADFYGVSVDWLLGTKGENKYYDGRKNCDPDFKVVVEMR